MVLPIKTVTAILAILQNENTLTILLICLKLTAIAEVVSAGQNIIIITGYSAAASQKQHAVRKAIS